MKGLDEWLLKDSDDVHECPVCADEEWTCDEENFAEPSEPDEREYDG